MVMDSSDEEWRKEAQLTKYYNEREKYYIDLALDMGDSIQRENPGVLRIRILRPKKEKPDA